MKKMHFVLPTAKVGTPQNVDAFLKLEDLEGCCFESMGEAEEYLLKVRTIYAIDERFEGFAIFTNVAHAVPTSHGYKISETVSA